MFNDNGSFLLALFEIFLFFAWFMCLFWIFGDIFRSKDLGGVARTLWVLFVIFVPWLGILVYLIVRGRGMQERQLEQAIQMQRAQAEYIRPWPAAPPQVPPIRSGRRKVCSSPVRSRRQSSSNSRRRPSPPDRRTPRQTNPHETEVMGHHYGGREILSRRPCRLPNHFSSERITPLHGSELDDPVSRCGPP